MGLPRIKISSIWRVAILLGLSALLYGCGGKHANIKNGSFDVDLPKPFWGPGIFLYQNELHIRGSLSYSIEDEEFSSINDASMETDVKYDYQKNPLSGSLDIFYKMSRFDWGGRLAVEPYPSITLFVGLNDLYGEVGAGFRLGYSKDKASYSGHYIYESCTFVGCIDKEEGDFQETERSYNNANFEVFVFSSIFVTDVLSVNFSTGLYQPWLFRRSLYFENVDNSEDYILSISFPFIFSQYAGVSLFLLEHIQLNVGESVYGSPSLSKWHWQTNISASYLF